MGILDRYVGKSVLIMIVVVVIFLTILTAIITFIDQTRYLGRGSIDFIFLLKYLFEYSSSLSTSTGYNISNNFIQVSFNNIKFFCVY